MNIQKAPDSELLFYQTENGQTRIQVRVHEDTIWMTQKSISKLYQTSVSNINQHIKAIYDEQELQPEATIKKYLIVQTEGRRDVERLVDHYSLEMILSVGYRVRSKAGTQFRQWATDKLKEYVVKGFTIDDERLKDNRNAGQDYFDELIERIRDIRASERRFYQKITDIYASCSIDYDKNSEITKEFYATVQNKLHWAIHRHTAAEVIKERADASKPNMGLTSWKNAPEGKIRKTDVTVAKNYLTQEELNNLNRIVTMYLDYAETQAQNRKSMTMTDWVTKLDAFLQFNEKDILTDSGKISAEIAKQIAEGEFKKYQDKSRTIEASEPTSDFDIVVRRIGK